MIPGSIPIVFGQDWLLRGDSNLCGGRGGEALRWGDRMRDAWAAEEEAATYAFRYRPAQAAFAASACEASLTSIFFGMDLAGLGIVTLRMPFDMVAWTLDGSMSGGNCSTRMNMP